MAESPGKVLEMQTPGSHPSMSLVLDPGDMWTLQALSTDSGVLAL
jgi:hypothetical protein